MPSLRHFQPSATNPWNRVKAAHLLGRADFSATPDVTSRLADARIEAAVDELLNFESVQENAFPDVDFAAINQMYMDFVRLRQSRADARTIRAAANELNRANREKYQELRANWVSRMIRTNRPLQEKMVLFWHGFLVSGFPETRAAQHMAIQLDLFRRMATGNFKELILAISRDPRCSHTSTTTRTARDGPMRTLRDSPRQVAGHRSVQDPGAQLRASRLYLVNLLASEVGPRAALMLGARGFLGDSVNFLVNMGDLRELYRSQGARRKRGGDCHLCVDQRTKRRRGLAPVLNLTIHVLRVP